jgi:hypothetical protein
VSFLITVVSTIAALPLPPAGAAVMDFAATERCPLEALEPSFVTIGTPRADRGDSDVLVFVSSAVAAPLAGRLARFQADLESEGFTVTMEEVSGGTASDLRNRIRSHTGVDGVIMIGWLPAAWYELDEWEWGGAHEEFPLDLYFMDIDGYWGDADGDGLYDSHTGDVDAEIWVGRIDAHAVEFGGEVRMLADFLDKNHFYRTGAMTVPARALAFIDDDWSYYYGNCGLSSIYPTVDVYSNRNQTTAAFYRDRLAYGYEFVHLMSHSSPWGHTFKTTSGYSGTVMAPEIAQINPQTVFIQLFACSNCRWTEPNCLGNWYLFGTDYCQLATGSTKTGSMLDFEVFYEPIGEGGIPGESFRDWMNQVGIHDEAWHYGCVLLGDPTIRPTGSGTTAAIPPYGPEPRGGGSWIRVSSSPHSDCYPSVAGSAGNLWVAWMTSGSARLDIATRHYDGTSWGPVTVVDLDEYWDVQPTLALDASGEPWLAWSSFEESSYGYDIVIAHGAGFGTVTTLVDGSGYDVDPSLSLAGGRLWLAWQTWRRGEGDIMIKTVDTTFPETILSGPAGFEDFSPTSAADESGYVHVAWVRSDHQGDRIMWSRGNASGFSAPVALTEEGCFSRSPSLSFAGGAMRLVWQEGDASGVGTSIRIRSWNGGSWSAPETIHSTGADAPCLPVVGTSPTGALFTAWQQGRGASARLRASTLTGSGWSTPGLLIDMDGPAWAPALCPGVIAWAGDETGSDWNVWVSLDGGVGIEGPAEPAPAGPALLANPVRGAACLVLPQGWTGADVEVRDLAGRIVRKVHAEADGGLAEFSCEGLPTGTYLLAVTSGEETTGLRMTVIR